MTFSPALLLSTAALLIATASAQNVRNKPELDRDSLTPSTTQLGTLVRDAVDGAGGDLERQNIHWVFAFSTGHYKSDPLGAQAAREFVRQFVTSNAVTGDRITVRAWELDVWPHKDSNDSTLLLSQNAVADKASASNLWPTTPAVGSIGGHDTERTAVQLAEEFKDDAGTVLVLVTNTAASVGAPGGKLLGANAPEYQNLLSNWTRVKSDAGRDGATLVVPFVMKLPSGDRKNQLETVVFVPKTFSAASMETTERSERLASERAPVTPTARTGTNDGSGGALFGLPGLVALGGLGFFAWKTFRGSGGGSATLRIEGQSFRLRDFPSGRPMLVLAGPGFRAEDDTPVVPVQGAPNEKFAEFLRVGNDVRVRGVSDTFELKEVNGSVVTGATLLKLRPEMPDHALEFSGEVRATSGVPRSVTKVVNVALTQGEV